MQLWYCDRQTSDTNCAVVTNQVQVRGNLEEQDHGSHRLSYWAAGHVALHFWSKTAVAVQLVRRFGLLMLMTLTFWWHLLPQCHRVGRGVDTVLLCMTKVGDDLTKRCVVYGMKAGHMLVGWKWHLSTVVAVAILRQVCYRKLNYTYQLLCLEFHQLKKVGKRVRH